jgi:hypothetical protein
VFDPLAPPGLEALHPGRDDFEAVFRRVGGVGFDDIVAYPIDEIPLGANFPQIRWRTKLCIGVRDLPLVGVRLSEVTLRGRVRSADELREHTSLSAETQVVLLLFDHDELLERLADRWEQSVAEIAAGGYALVLPPSFSLWERGRRPDNLLSLRRSKLALARLQDAGVNAIARVGWVEMRDVERLAEWVLANPAVETVALDLMTYKEKSFDHAVSLLSQFDRLTGERLRYIINGVLAASKIVALYLAVAPDRITVTEATVARVPTSPNARSFAARYAELQAACSEARRRYEVLPVEQSVEDFLEAEHRPSLALIRRLRGTTASRPR